MPGLLDRSCGPRQATRPVVGGGRVCVACGEPTTAAKETYLWPTADFGIMFGEKSGLTVVILAGNFSGGNEALVRIIPWLNKYVCMLSSLRRL